MKTAIEPDKMAIVLAGLYPEETTYFKNAFEGLKLRYSLAVCDEGRLLEYLASEPEPPHLIFLDAKTSGTGARECLRKIRNDPRFTDTSIALYVDVRSDEALGAYYLDGANICIRAPEPPQALEKIVSEIVYLNWQYLTNGLDREKFILKY
jgi:CheY-like chemotaxis protein